MKLKVLLPAEIFLTEEVTKVVAEAENGFFCLMSQHVDFTTALVPGVFSFTTPNGEDHYCAVDIGTLVKKGADILVSTRSAFRGTGTGSIERGCHRAVQGDRRAGEEGPHRRRQAGGGPPAQVHGVET